jgi:hypothetical protein
MCRELVGLNFPTVLVWFRRLDEARRRFFRHVGVERQRSRWRMSQNPNRNYTAEGTIEARTAVMLKANALEVIDAELARLEDRLEKLMHGWDRVRNEIIRLCRANRSGSRRRRRPRAGDPARRAVPGP